MQNDPGHILEIADLYKHFQGIQVLRGVHLSIQRGSITALIGSNGAGKSTLLNLVSGALGADRGTIRLCGRDVTKLPSYQRARAGLARTFQHPRVFHSLSVAESVEFAATEHHKEQLPRSLVADLGKSTGIDVIGCLRRCKIDHLVDSTTGDLGYGEQKLLMLAQVLAGDAELLCFDELCAGLEPVMVDHIKEMFRQLVAEKKSILFIEHNLELVRAVADRVVFLHLGEVFREGETASVLEDPEVVRHYLGS